LSVNFGTNWSLIGIALVLSCPMTWLELRYWRQLSISTLVGIPELSQQRKGQTTGEGIYGVVRHPRYLSAGIGIITPSCHRLGVMSSSAVVPPGYLMLVLRSGNPWPPRRLSGVSVMFHVSFHAREGRLRSGRQTVKHGRSVLPVAKCLPTLGWHRSSTA
jgi:protein-S-isoprenylcysteine O-methyltransferase Ste14